MPRRWYNEDYRKLYTRQDARWLALPACARALAADLLRYADDRGVAALVVEDETPAQAVGSVIRAKADELEWVERAVRALLKDGYLEHRGSEVTIRNFAAAQERLSQDAVRKRRQRDNEDRERQSAGSANIHVPNSPPDGGAVTPDVTPQVAMFPVAGTNGAARDVTAPVTGKVTVAAAVIVRRDETRRDETRREKERDTPAPAHVSDLGKPESAAKGKLVDAHLVDALSVIDELNAARKRARPASTGIRPSYASLALIAARLDAGKTREECLRVVAAGEAECRRPRRDGDEDPFRWFDAISPFRPENFERRLAQVASPTAPESRRAERQPLPTYRRRLAQSASPTAPDRLPESAASAQNGEHAHPEPARSTPANGHPGRPPPGPAGEESTTDTPTEDA